MAVVILNYQISADYLASAHRADCRDIKRDTDEHAAIQYGPFPTLEEALSDYIDEEMLELGWSESDVRIFPCCQEA